MNAVKMLAKDSFSCEHGSGIISALIHQRIKTGRQTDQVQLWSKTNLGISLASNASGLETRSKHIIEITLDELCLPS